MSEPPVATLPPAPWRAAPGLARLLDALGGEARAVGGAVRDTLAGRPVSDVDLATPLPPETVVARLEAAGLKAVPTGIAHGTVTGIADHVPYEITTLRRDVATDGRHATVAFTVAWREDAARRDFTINALYADPAAGDIWDYFGGIADLAAGRVRFIGDPAARIAEDHLRILRYFRFLARYGDNPDGAALDACAAAARSLMALSRERIADELVRILTAPDPGDALATMAARGIFDAFLPEIDGDAVESARLLIGREAAAGLAPDPLRRLAALLPDAPTADSVAARLKLSRRARARLVAAHGPLPARADTRARAYADGVEAVTDRILRSAEADDVAPMLAQLAGWQPPALPLSGGALVARGIGAGPLVAQTLQAIERDWAAAGFPGDAAFDALVEARVAEALAGG